MGRRNTRTVGTYAAMLGDGRTFFQRGDERSGYHGGMVMTRLHRVRCILLVCMVAALGSLALVPRPPASSLAAQQAPQAETPGTWTAGPALGTTRTEVAAAAVDGVLYVVGQYLGGTAPSGANEAFDPRIGTWALRASLPAELHHACAAAVDGRLYVVGGYQAAGGAAVSTLHAYDPAADAWTALRPMPTARGALVCPVVDGRIYAIGGDGASGDTGAVEVYDPTTDAWDTGLPLLPTPRNHIAGAALDGKIYVVGGRAARFGSLMQTHEVLDTATRTWAAAAPLPTGRSGMMATVFRGRMHVIGGEGGPATFAEHEAYDPTTGTWTAFAPLPTPRHGLAVVTLDDAIYAASGGPQPGGTFSDALEIFTLP
jgi:N-acetylneuraminic acid mutarotase